MRSHTAVGRVLGAALALHGAAAPIGVRAQDGAAAEGAPSAELSPAGFSRAADVLVLRYRVLNSLIAGDEKGPTLAVYGDGRVVAHYPPYMVAAGTYETVLAPEELDRLIADAAAEVAEYDAEAVEREVARRERRASELEAVSDPAYSELLLTLDWYAPPGSRAPAAPLARRVSVADLQGEAERHPLIGPIARLAALERRLLRLLEPAGLVRTGGPEAAVPP